VPLYKEQGVVLRSVKLGKGRQDREDRFQLHTTRAECPRAWGLGVLRRPLLPNVGCPDANRTVSDDEPLETAWASLLATTHFVGGDGGTRTRDILLANQGLADSLTSGFTSSAGHRHDSGEVERRKARL
jgi:hypothetical protein